MISCLAGLPEDFPIREWDELLPHIFLTLNLLQALHMMPTVLAYAYHHWQFDYDPMPLAPMGKPKLCKTWGEHLMDWWYLRTSPKHYRCHVVFVKKTRSIRELDMVYFKHQYITQPTITPEDAIVKAL